MSYLVLARKWRPRSFDTLIGQDHVVRALTHALSTQRLHHAWLFTGTRGVGKTTLSRILAKALNCETGITDQPCGECAACTEIDAGRFVDYIELDAASNRGVDEMTQLLEQAVYSPSGARFKVYMIDEVHMLSGHAFNAMLKTLEEPPPHVKFILATTDPQKIPATVLSRCLQFNLKQMAAGSIISYLEYVLGQEKIPYEAPGLRLLASAASGSMRDALSLADQAIAYSAGAITSDAVQAMLGTIDQTHMVRLLHALGSGDASAVIAVADELASRGLSYAGALADVSVLLSRIAIEQRVPGAVQADDALYDDIRSLAASLHPDAVQLFYTVAVHSRHELSLAPDEYAGFVMACLRMLSLAPAAEPQKTASLTENASAAQDAAEPAADTQSGSAALQGDAAHPESVIKPQSGAESAPVVQPESASVVQPEFAPVVEPESTIDRAPESVSEAPPSVDPAVAAPLSSAPPPSSAQSMPVPAQPEASLAAQVPSPDEPPPWEDIPDEVDFSDAPDYEGFETLAVAPDVRAAIADAVPRPARPSTSALGRMTAQAWPALVARLPLTGAAAELARQSEWLGVKDACIHLRMAIPTLGETSGRSRLRTVLSEHFGVVVDLDIEYAQTGDATAHAIEQAHREKLQQQAERDVQEDPFVNTLLSDFGGRIVSGSVRAVYDNAQH